MVSPYFCAVNTESGVRWWFIMINSILYQCWTLKYLETLGLNDCLHAEQMCSCHVSLWPQEGDKALLLLCACAAEKAWFQKVGLNLASTVQVMSPYTL